jgi:hypothetical protein
MNKARQMNQGNEYGCTRKAGELRNQPIFNDKHHGLANTRGGIVVLEFIFLLFPATASFIRSFSPNRANTSSSSNDSSNSISSFNARIRPKIAFS